MVVGTTSPLIIGIGGSTSAASVTDRLLLACLASAESRGAQTAAILGAELATLPIFGDSSAADDLARRLVALVRSADCLVIGTPGYHGGMSGLVKNALDHLEFLRDDPRPYLEGRAVGVIVAAAGWQACGTTLTSVRSTIHALRGWPTPFGVTVNSAEKFETDDGEFDTRISGALEILVDQLLEFCGRRGSRD
jgi:FMN reductase